MNENKNMAQPVDAGVQAATSPADGTPRVDALMKRWEEDATRGTAFFELRDLARELERAALAQAAPADLTDEPMRACEDCDGSGRLSPQELCARCDASGILPAARAAVVAIPAPAEDPRIAAFYKLRDIAERDEDVESANVIQAAISKLHWDRVDDEVAQPAGAGAPSVLTGAQIAEIYQAEFNSTPGARRAAPATVPPLVIAFGEAVQRAALARQGAAPAQAEPVALDESEQYRQQMAAISVAAHGYWKETESIHPDYDTVPLRDVAKLYAKYEALATASAHAGVAQAEQSWAPLTGPGQIVPGDQIRFTTGGKQRIEIARLVLEAGTEEEEIVYDVARNWYFITRMAVAGESHAKDVEYRAAIQASSNTGSEG